MINSKFINQSVKSVNQSVSQSVSQLRRCLSQDDNRIRNELFKVQGRTVCTTSWSSSTSTDSSLLQSLNHFPLSKNIVALVQRFQGQTVNPATSFQLQLIPAKSITDPILIDRYSGTRNQFITDIDLPIVLGTVPATVNIRARNLAKPSWLNWTQQWVVDHQTMFVPKTGKTVTLQLGTTREATKQKKKSKR